MVLISMPLPKFCSERSIQLSIPMTAWLDSPCMARGLINRLSSLYVRQFLLARISGARATLVRFQRSLKARPRNICNSIMFFQLIPLALLPLAVSASPTPSKHNLYCYAQGKDLFEFHINDTVTKDVCKSLNSGKYHNMNNEKYCSVADYDVKWFKERCQSHPTDVKTTKWIAGTDLKIEMDPKEPYELYCFNYYTTFGNLPDAGAKELDDDATKKACSALKSGKYQSDPKKKSCRMDEKDIDQFKEQCSQYQPSDRPPYGDWSAGTSLNVVLNLKKNA